MARAKFAIRQNP